MILVIVEQTGARAEVGEVEEAIHEGRRLLEEARREGVKVPYASFYGPDGQLVRAKLTRTDLAAGRGVCWCGRSALRVKDGIPFCCSKHEVLWAEWSDDLRARTIVARFIAIYGGRLECRNGSTKARSASRSTRTGSTRRTGSTPSPSTARSRPSKPKAARSPSKKRASGPTSPTSGRGALVKPMAPDRVRRVERALAGQDCPRQARTISHLAGVPLGETRGILERMETRGKARRTRGCWEAVR